MGDKCPLKAIVACLPSETLDMLAYKEPFAENTMENSIYLEVLLHVMKMTLLENTSPDDPELSQALAILRDETNDLCSLCQIIERGIHTSLDFPPGYLLKMFSPWRIAIPWPLAESFPVCNPC